VINTTDQAGPVTHNVYDFAGRLSSATAAYGTADAAITSYTYYGDGRYRDAKFFERLRARAGRCRQQAGRHVNGQKWFGSPGLHIGALTLGENLTTEAGVLK
jgi:hypothetical protein